MKLLIRPLTSLLLLLSACAKDDSAPVLTGSYRTESTIRAGVMLLYTANGVTSNSAAISRFLRHYPNVRSYFLRRDSTLTGYPLELNFRENNRVTLASVVPPGTDDHMVEWEVTTRARKHYLLSELDSVVAYKPSTGYPYNQSPCGELAQKVREHQPAQRCFNVAQASGYEQVCRFRPLHLLTFRNEQPALPLLSWLGVVARNGRQCWVASGSEWNTPSPSLRQNLSAGDTVLVQLNEVMLRKQ